MPFKEDSVQLLARLGVPSIPCDRFLRVLGGQLPNQLDLCDEVEQLWGLVKKKCRTKNVVYRISENL